MRQEAVTVRPSNLQQRTLNFGRKKKTGFGRFLIISAYYHLWQFCQAAKILLATK